jgi:hypothetical protein
MDKRTSKGIQLNKRNIKFGEPTGVQLGHEETARIKNSRRGRKDSQVEFYGHFSYWHVCCQGVTLYLDNINERKGETCSLQRLRTTCLYLFVVTKRRTSNITIFLLLSLSL